MFSAFRKWKSRLNRKNCGDKAFLGHKEHPAPPTRVQDAPQHRSDGSMPQIVLRTRTKRFRFWKWHGKSSGSARRDPSPPIPISDQCSISVSPSSESFNESRHSLEPNSDRRDTSTSQNESEIPDNYDSELALEASSLDDIDYPCHILARFVPVERGESFAFDEQAPVPFTISDSPAGFPRDSSLRDDLSTPGLDFLPIETPGDSDTSDGSHLCTPAFGLNDLHLDEPQVTSVDDRDDVSDSSGLIPELSVSAQLLDSGSKYQQHEENQELTASPENSEQELVGLNIISSPSAKYNVQYRLGAGATSHVMYATALVNTRDPWDDYNEADDTSITYGEVAIKVFHKPQIAYYTFANEANLPIVTPSRLAAERNILVMITESGSPFLTPLLESFQDMGNVYFVMKLYPMSLHSRLCRMDYEGKKMHIDEIRFYAAELLVAIEHLHSLNIAHRDIKPENILISPSGHLALTDFGLSVHIPPKGNRGFAKRKRFEALGTPAYVPPELWDSRMIMKGYLVAAADLWMYGAVVLQMYLGRATSYFSPHPEERDDYVMMSNLVSDSDAADLLSLILNAPEGTRLSIPQIKNHKFFSEVNWDDISAQKIAPYYIPGPPICQEVNQSVAFSTFYVNYSASKLKSSLGGMRALELRVADYDALDIYYRCPEGILKFHVNG